MANKFLKFLLNFCFLLLVVFLCDRLVGGVLRHFYFKQVAGEFYRTTFAMDSTTADILIFGSSRANHHYVPEVFEKGFKMSYYNTGRDGNFILYNYAVFKVILSRHIPKIIILEIGPYEFCYDPVSYERLSSLLPYYSNHQEIRSIVNLRSPFEKYKLFLSAIYPFNSLLTTIGIGNLNVNKKRKPDDNGYIPLYGKDVKEADFIPFQNTPCLIDTNKLQALDSIAKLCFKKNIRFLICYSPIYIETRYLKIDTLIASLAAQYNFKYFNFSNEPSFISRPELFRDINHLNNDGAIYYSTLVVDSIFCNYGNPLLPTLNLITK